LANLKASLFSVTDHHGVKKQSHRFRIEAGGTTSDKERERGVSFFRKKRDSAQIQHGEHIGEAELVLEAEPDYIELGQTPARLHGRQGNVPIPQLIFEICPRAVNSFSGQPRRMVQQIIEDFEPHVRHAYFVDIGEGKSDGNLHMERILFDRIDFVPHITARVLNAGKPFFV
jgi:hypothetical protein